ncbi:hypothetical protein [Psychrobacter cryohalolentis]
MISLALSKGVDEERIRAMQLLSSLGDLLVANWLVVAPTVL